MRKNKVNKKVAKPQDKAEAKKKAAPKKAVTKKTASKKVAAAEAPRVSTPVAENSAPTQARPITAEERHRMIEEAAYYRALERDDHGQAEHDWAEAEAAIDAMLAEEGLQVA